MLKARRTKLPLHSKARQSINKRLNQRKRIDEPKYAKLIQLTHLTSSRPSAQAQSFCENKPDDTLQGLAIFIIETLQKAPTSRVDLTEVSGY